MRNLRTQLFLAIMIIVLFIVSVSSFFSNIIVNKEFEKYIEKQQKIKVSDIVSNFHDQYNFETQEWNVEYLHGMGMYALLDGYIISVYDNDGKSVWDAQNHDMTGCSKIMEEIAERMEKRRPNIGGKFVAYDYELELRGEKIGSISISYYGPYFLSESDFHFIDTLNIVLVAIGIISLILSLIVSGILAKRIASPITKTAYIAKQISEGNYSIQFEGKTKSRELDELAAAINYLSNALAEQESLRKRLTVDVAHELRTPLTTLSSHLEAMILGVWQPSTERLQSCSEEIDRLSGLVSDLERLAKTEKENLVLNKTKVDLMEIVCSCCDNFEIEMKNKSQLLLIEGNSLFICADKDKISQVMANLVSNAVKYTLESGNISIKVEDLQQYALITIEDDGIGIPENELSLVFERFYRTDESRNRKTGGAGIGLAIVKSIIAAHGGTVEAQNKAERGSRFVVRLPKQ